MLAVVNDIAVGVVVDNKDIVFPAELHDLFIKPGSRYASHRVGGEGNDHVFRFFCHIFGDILHTGEKIMFRSKGIVVGNSSRHETSRREYRVTGIRKKNRVSLVADGHAQMAHSLLASVNRHHHIRGDLHLETFLIIFADSVQKFRDISETVFPVLVIHGGFGKGFLDMLRGFEIRGAHTHVIYFHSLLLQLHFPVVESGKDLISESVQSF